MNQFMASSEKLEFIQNVALPKLSLTVVEVIPVVTVVKSSDDILAGIEQEVDLVIRAGSTSFPDVIFLS